MNAQELLDDAARTELLPRELWDIVPLPVESEPATVDVTSKPPLSPALEVVDLHELPAIAEDEVLSWRLRRLLGWSSVIVTVSLLMFVWFVAIAVYTKLISWVWVGIAVLAIGSGMMLVLSQVKRIINEGNNHVNGS